MYTKMAESVLPELEKAMYSAFFQAADRDKNGYLDISELANVTKMCGLNLTQKEIADTFIEMDLNNDWKISLDEFIAGMHSLKPGRRKLAILNRKLTNLDREDSGYLSYREIQNATESVKEINQQEVETAFQEMKISDLNKVDYKSLVKILEKKLM